MQNNEPFVDVTVSNADLKAGTWITLVAAQGVGTFVTIDKMYIQMLYGGTNVWTNNPNMWVRWGGGAATITIGAFTGLWTTAGDGFGNYLVGEGGVRANYENLAVTWRPSIVPTGNAGNDNTVVIRAYYKVENFI